MADATVATRRGAARRALARADAGKSLSLDEPDRVAAMRGATTSTGCSAIAARLRDLGWGDIVTYSRKVFVPLTMLCRDHCHYCTFAEAARRARVAPYLDPG